MNFKKLFRSILATLLITFMVCSITASAASTSTKIAYCIGVKHASTDTNSGDFTTNVSNAAFFYDGLSNYNAYTNTSPSSTFLQSTRNTNGVKILASDVVFINGHGNFAHISFGEAVGTGIYYGTTYTSSKGIEYTGLKSIGYLGSTDLISFVGCNTASSSSNLCTVAISLGATTALGFTDSISSRTGYGPNWLNVYNSYLIQGYTVSKAAKVAASFYPDCSLSLYYKIYGDSTNYITDTPASLISTLSSVNLASTSTSNSALQLNNLENCVDVPITICEIDGIDNLLSEIKSQYPSFNSDNYKLSVNMFSDDGTDGILIFKYYIGDEIATNYAYIVSIEDCFVEEILPSAALVEAMSFTTVTNLVRETDLLQLVNDFESSPLDFNTALAEGDAYSTDNEPEITRAGYHFDYSTGELTYVIENYYLSGDIYTDEVFTWILN